MTASGTASECKNCASTVELTKEEWACFAGRLDRYRKMSGDPVFVVVVACDDEAGASTSRAGDPSLRSIKGQGQSEKKAPPPIVLTKAQLECIDGLMDDILDEPGDEPIRVNLAEECPAEPPQSG